jgi:hypothetical protein
LFTLTDGAVAPLLGVQLAQPLADVISFAISIPLTVGVLRHMEKDKPIV